MEARYSDLPEVVQAEHHIENRPQAVQNHELPEPFHVEERVPNTPASYGVEKPSETGRPRRQCGLAPKVFWAVAVTSILVIGAIVGGVVGGTLANRDRSATSGTDDPAPTSSSPGLSASTIITTSMGPLTTSTETFTRSSKTYTLLRDCPSSNYTTFNPEANAPYQFRKVCEADFYGTTNSFINQQTKSLDECISRCVKHNAN